MSKYRVVICDDSAAERQRFYARHFDHFEIYGVHRRGSLFVEADPMDSVQKLHRFLLERQARNDLPDVVVLDLFYKRPIPGVDELEGAFIRDLLLFKAQFRALKNRASEYLSAAGVDFLTTLREEEKISADDLPVLAYTDKNFNFLPTDAFNALYRLDPEFVYKDRDDDEPRSQISADTEYLRIVTKIRRSARRRKSAVFISHGRSPSPLWREVQQFLEQDLGIETLEQGRGSTPGRSTVEKLTEASNLCHRAIVVVTVDDTSSFGEHRSRENVMHEIGFLQAKLGFDRLVILHEEGALGPHYLADFVNISFPKGNVRAAMIDLERELRA